MPVEDVKYHSVHCKCGKTSTELPELLYETFREGCENMSLDQASDIRSFLVCHKETFADPRKLVPRKFR